MNTPVDFTTAQFLKEKGFDKSLDTILNTVYDIEDMSLMKNVHQETLTKGKELFLHAPTIAEVVMWLYEKHGIWIIVSHEISDLHQTEWFWIGVKNGEEIASQYFGFNSPTEAYEAAIVYTLKNLI